MSSEVNSVDLSESDGESNCNGGKLTNCVGSGQKRKLKGNSESALPVKKRKGKYKAAGDVERKPTDETNNSLFEIQNQDNKALSLSTKIGSKRNADNAPELSSKKQKLNDDNAETSKSRNEVNYTSFEAHHQDNKGFSMMTKMGYEKGKGLGLEGQGRVDALAPELRLGRAGLGAKKTGLEPDFQKTWDIDSEEIDVEEKVNWMPECPDVAPATEDMTDWIRTGKKVTEIDNETEFCSQEILKEMLSAKSVFDELRDFELRNARTRANPFETIKGAIFLNRAAMKMANMDAVFDFQLSDPKIKGESMAPRTGPDLFYFADVCAGPGGFTEYMLWKRDQYSAHGFGFTLTGKDDFKLEKFGAACPEYFEPHYGVSGTDGDGDVTNPENLQKFRDFVMKVTCNKGIHFFMADGGFSVEGQENIQEILSKRLYLCQILCCLNILAVGGNFICKLFDVFTPFSAGLLYLMWRCFDKVCLHKPHTSRPANSERYIVCLGFRPECEDVRKHLWNANLEYNRISQEKMKDEDVLELVPLSVLTQSKEFCDYLTDSNEKMAQRQTLYLNKYRTFAQNRNLIEDSRQDELRSKCLQYWNIPNIPHTRPATESRTNCTDRFRELCQGDEDWKNRKWTPISDETIEELNFLEYRVAVVSTESPCVVLGIGGNQNYLWEGTRWDRLFEFKLNLPKDTIVLGETTYEYQDGQGKNQQRFPVLRIFDGFLLNGNDISKMPLRNRLAELRKFCLATSREHSRSDLAVSKVVEFFKLDDLHSAKFQNRIDQAICNRPLKLAFKSEDQSRHVELRKFLFYKIPADPWKILWSKSNARAYVWNAKTDEKSFDMHKSCYSSFKEIFASRQFLSSSHSGEPLKQKDFYFEKFNAFNAKDPKHHHQHQHHQTR